jgi:iron complex transport system ATP-binding protein
MLPVSLIGPSVAIRRDTLGIALAASNLHFGYEPGRGVLRGVDAAFEPGRVTAVLGPNGAGKTTLLRLLAGLAGPDRGAATLEGRPVARLPERERARRIAYIAQRTELAFAYTARQVVEFGLHAPGADHDAADRALRRVGVEDLAARPFAELSVGQQQRITLARALAQLDRPPVPVRVLLADEPLAALDPRHVAACAGLLRELASSGAVVVLVLHDLPAAIRLADNALLLTDGGTVAGHGPVADVLEPGLLGRVFGVPFRRVGAGADAVPLPEV